MSEPADDDVTRRTRLAAERTWLAWWRSGIAAATAAVAVGGVVPELVEGGRTAYVLLGAGYAALAVGVFAAGAMRRRQVDRGLERGEYERVSEGAVLLLTVAAIALALGTFAVIVAQA
jgi:putative membrane protein